MEFLGGIWRWARALARLSVLLATSSQAGISFFLRRPRTARERSLWLHHWCNTVLRRLNIETIPDGRFPSRGLLISNHLSYLDILVFSAVSPCVFVSKLEVRSWPLYGALAHMAGTIFVDRSRSTEATRVNADMAQVLSEGNVVVLFPEGTSSDGTTVLPFRTALFESAVQLNEDISSAHLSYVAQGGVPEQDVCYWGTMTFVPHLLRLMALEKVVAHMKFAPGVQKFDDRKMAANATRQLVLQLANSLAEKTVIMPNAARGASGGTS